MGKGGDVLDNIFIWDKLNRGRDRMEKDKQISSLSAPVRPGVIAKYFGQLCLILSALPAVSLVVSLYFMEFSFSLSNGIVCVFLIIIGLSLGRLKAPKDIRRHEALVLTALVFVFSSVVMSYPFTASGLSVIDAWFEAVSAVTTTGLSTLPSVENMPRTFLFTRSWLQWAGGLGFIVFSVAMIVGPGQAARRLMDFEETEDIVGGTRSYARRVLTVYILLTVFGTMLLFVLGVRFYPALLHALSAVSTGGFSTYDNSLAGLGGRPVQIAAMFITFAGGIPIVLYYMSYKKGIGHFLNDIQVRALVFFVLTFSILMMAALKGSGMTWGHSLFQGPLMALSAQTTAGFSSMAVSEMNMQAKGLLVISMAIGASAGSSAGGMKIFRVLIFLKMILLTIRKTLLPRHAVVSYQLGGQSVSEEEILTALLVILLFIAVVLVSWLAFLAAGYGPLDALFDVVSATCTVGLSTGVVSSALPVTLKAVLCADMLFGRVEIIAMLVLLYPGTWFGRKGSQI